MSKSPGTALAETDVREKEEVPGRLGFWRRFVQQRIAVLSLAFLFGLCLIAVFAPWVTPKDPFEQSLMDAFKGFGREFWMGTDNLGRDTLSRIILGSRATLLAAVQGVGIALAIGVPFGLVSGYLGGRTDRAVMWLNDLILSLPMIVVAFAIIAILGAGLSNAMIAVGLVLSTRYIRLTRGMLLAEREKIYVEAAKVSGIPNYKILVLHILPNVVSPLIVQTSIFFGIVILIEAALSFIGLGAPVGTPSWGRMLNEARSYYSLQPVLAIPPGIAITLTVLAFNLLGDGLRDVIGRGVTAGNPPVHRSPETVPVQTIGDEATPDLSINQTALGIKDIEVRFPLPNGGEVNVIQGVSIDLKPGETLGLVGESGSGKSMTALAAMGLIPYPGFISNGSVALDGRNLLGLSNRDWNMIRGNTISMIFQEPLAALNPVLTVGQQISEPLRLHKNMSPGQARERAAELLARVRVPEPHRRLDEYPHQYSGGMAQRAVIARALACDPEILIADEPTTALDVSVQGQVLDLLRDFQEESDMAMLFITHNLGVASDMCDRIAVMYAGLIIEIGKIDDVMNNPRHPYTSALLGAMPQNRKKTGRLTNIKGQVPPAWAWPEGCRFHPRCDYAIDQCAFRQLDLTEVSSDHSSRCLRSSDHKVWNS